MSKRIIVIIVLVAFVVLLSLARFMGVGAGLRIVMESEPCIAPGCFESISHFTYLYDGTARVSRVGQADISPGGRYAAFEDNGKIMLYDRETGKLKDVTDGRFAIPEMFEWNEAQGKLAITYYQENLDPIYANHPPSIIRLR